MTHSNSGNSASRPNLFRFATSELSQDAFIAWLLAWGDDGYADQHAQLHGLGSRLLRRLAHTPGRRLPSNFKVKVERQVKQIDVAVLINDNLVLLIEDKTGTTHHSNQLQRYQQAAKQHWPNRRQVCVYFKTGEESAQIHLPPGWKPFYRPQFLETLHTGAHIKNEILRDFTDHLETIEDEVTACEHTSIADWGDNPRAWRGFFNRIQQGLGEGHWDYVDNPKGGFMGFWWGGRVVDGTAIYLQLQQDVLQAKISLEKKPRSERAPERERWSAAVINGPGKARFKRPPRMGSGASMTIAESVAGDYRAVYEDGVVNVPATVKRLKAAMRYLQASVDAELGG